MLIKTKKNHLPHLQFCFSKAPGSCSSLWVAHLQDKLIWGCIDKFFLIHSTLRYYPDGWSTNWHICCKDVAWLTFGFGEVCSLKIGSLMKNTKTKDRRVLISHILTLNKTSLSTSDTHWLRKLYLLSTFNGQVTLFQQTLPKAHRTQGLSALTKVSQSVTDKGRQGPDLGPIKINIS